MERKAKVISFINMKGGVAKTTLTINIAEELAIKGNKVIVLDMDPQFNATQSLLLHRTRIRAGVPVEVIKDQIEEEEIEKEMNSASEYNELSKKKLTILQIFESTQISGPHENPSLSQEIIPNLYLIPGDLTLAKEVSGDTANKVSAVYDHLNETNILDEYDFVLIDCPPTWSILTHSSLFASDYYIIPSKVDFYSSIGIQLLEEQIENKITNNSIYKMTKRKLTRLGLIFTLVHRTVKAEETRMKNLQEQFTKIDFFSTILPHMPSIPTRFVMYSDAKVETKYDQLGNSIEKIVTELLEKVRAGG